MSNPNWIWYSFFVFFANLEFKLIFRFFSVDSFDFGNDLDWRVKVVPIGDWSELQKNVKTLNPLLLFFEVSHSSSIGPYALLGSIKSYETEEC